MRAYARTDVRIAYSVVTKYAAIAHQIQVLPGYPHSSAGAYAGETSFRTVLDPKDNVAKYGSDICLGKQISLGKCVRGRAFPGGTHITVTPMPEA